MQSLIVIQGSKRDRFELHSSPVRIGSSPNNDLVVAEDQEVSANHCRVERDERQRWILRDDGSTNGTFLNDTPVRVARLQSGDRIRLGQSVLLFIDRVVGAQSRLQNLQILQEVNKALNSETDLARLLELIMDLAIHLTQAQRGFLVEVRDKQLNFKVARNIGYEAIESPEFKISNSVIRQVTRSGQPVLTSDAQADLASFQSIVKQEIRSLLCVPLRVKGRIIGTVYVDSHQEAVGFTEQDKELLQAFSDQAAIAIENARLLKETKESEAMRGELRVASRIQLALLPRQDPTIPGFEVTGSMLTAKEVGGDYYDYIAPLEGEDEDAPDDRYIAIGDVSGKGVPAGLVMVMARSVLRSLASSWEASPAELLAEVNRLLKPDLKPGMFMSMLLGRVFAAEGVVRLCGCGHERPLVFRARGGNVQAYDCGGIVLGVMPDVGSLLNDIDISLEPGDQLLLYTDGVTEAMNSRHEQYSLPRLMRTFARHGHSSPRELVAAILDDLARHRGEAEVNDDITLIALRRAPS
jgi:sigma-B regulation protein RsbU (phosphoserine phosphatase)